MADRVRHEALQTDREDLLALLRMRFGVVPADVQIRIATATERDTLGRLILVAANAPDWKTFMRELAVGPRAFRIAAQPHGPLASFAPAPVSSATAEPSGGEASQ